MFFFRQCTANLSRPRRDLEVDVDIASSLVLATSASRWLLYRYVSFSAEKEKVEDRNVGPHSQTRAASTRHELVIVPRVGGVT